MKTISSLPAISSEPTVDAFRERASSIHHYSFSAATQVAISDFLLNHFWCIHFKWEEFSHLCHRTGVTVMKPKTCFLVLTWLYKSEWQNVDAVVGRRVWKREALEWKSVYWEFLFTLLTRLTQSPIDQSAAILLQILWFSPATGFYWPHLATPLKFPGCGSIKHTRISHSEQKYTRTQYTVHYRIQLNIYCSIKKILDWLTLI